MRRGRRGEGWGEPQPDLTHRPTGLTVSVPMSDFFAPYHALTPPARAVAATFGVVYPHSMTRAQLARMLTQTGFRHEHRIIPHHRYKAACQDVISAGIADDTRYRGKLIASQDWAPWLTLQAFRDQRLERIETAFRACLLRSSPGPQGRTRPFNAPAGAPKGGGGRTVSCLAVRGRK